jgi:hypothetical protein
LLTLGQPYIHLKKGLLEDFTEKTKTAVPPNILVANKPIE